MFNRKLKQKIFDLEWQINSLQATALVQSRELAKKDQQIENLKYEIKNPAKFQIGEKVGGFIIMEKALYYKDPFVGLAKALFLAIPSLRNRQSGPIPKKQINDLFLERVWGYKVVNIKTNDRVFIKESELESIKKKK